MVWTFRALRSGAGKCFLNSFRRSKKEWKQSGTRMFWRGIKCEWKAHQQLLFLLLWYSCLHRPQEHALSTFCIINTQFEDTREKFHEHHCVPVFYVHVCGMRMGVCHRSGFSCRSTFSVNIKVQRAVRCWHNTALWERRRLPQQWVSETSALAARRVPPPRLAHLARGLGVNHLADVELPVCTQTHWRACARAVHLICQLQMKL